MSFGIHVERTLDGRTIEPGARWTHPTQQMRFQIVVVCDEVHPDRWHGEVHFAGQKLIATERVSTDGQAARDAQKAFDARVAKLFTNEP